MILTFSVLNGALRMAELPGESVTSLLQTVAYGSGLFTADSSDGVLGLLMSGLAGVAAALAIGIVLAVYVRIRQHQAHEIVKHGLAAALVVVLVAFVAYDMRDAGFAYLGMNPSKPAVEFEIRLPPTALSNVWDSQVELRTDRNQTLADMQDTLAPSGDGRSVLRGSVRLDYRTTERIVVLNMPGKAKCEFRLRLPANPSRSDQFGPWHLADHVAFPSDGEAAPLEWHDAFAIRYRVL